LFTVHEAFRHPIRQTQNFLSSSVRDSANRENCVIASSNWTVLRNDELIHNTSVLRDNKRETLIHYKILKICFFLFSARF